ncbi:LamG domain-containing protein [Iamia majanohamensis]|uniref:LamG domain-containing protein n=1 Tax=Iamia majanohamensis TaxID=467976 RepID=A0AAF0BSS9_9ACTN|nr:LamG domain-containing protein [Iamia majanohamensis]WCO65737.1 LamG domain-containing protein [Iamia majanohamensis]
MRVLAIALPLVLVAAGVVVWSPWEGGDAGPETNEVLDEDGDLAMPMPRLSEDVHVSDNDDGSLQVTFGIDYSVAHTGRARPGSPDADAKPDMAQVTVMVTEHVAPSGPIRLTPTFRQAVDDRELTDDTTSSRYSVRIPPKIRDYLHDQGLGSSDADDREAALRHIDIDVQQLRDWKVVDGTYDWAQGRAWTGADVVTESAAITDDSTITVTNATQLGIYGPDGTVAQDEHQVYDLGDWSRQADTDAYATDIALAGSPVECIDQGDGSNPQGFSMLNGWDVEDDLPPGTVPPGASVTQQVNADDGLGRTAPDVAQEYASSVVLSAAGWFGVSTPGVQSGIFQGAAVVSEAFGEELGVALEMASGVPVTALLGLADSLYEAATDSCASFANVLSLTAAEPAGAMTSIGWGDQTDGLDLTYDSASAGGSPVTNNVQTVPSTGVAAAVLDGPGEPLAFRPSLEQAATVACGTGCGGSANNLIDVRWSTQPQCPFTPLSTCVPTADEVADQPEVTVPGTDLCGPDNALCPPVAAAPNADAQETSAADDLAGAGYEVVAQVQPDAPITALATTEDGRVWAGDADGDLSEITDFAALDTWSTAEAGVTAMGALGNTVVWADEDGYVFGTDTTASTPLPEEVAELSQPVGHMAPDGDGLLYLAGTDRLWAYGGDGDPDEVDVDWPDGVDVTSMTANDTYLFVGFEDGWITRCTLTDCAGTWTTVHDGGFGSDAQGLTTVGDAVYVGLANGAQAQVDATTGATLVYGEPVDEGGQIAGMATVGGNVYTGGCLGYQSPVSGDLLGVEVLTALSEVDGETVPRYDPESTYDTCQNPTETTTKYKGFDPDQYAMLATPPGDGHPALVVVALTIGSGSFLYVLENALPTTDALCLGDDGCPSPGPAAPPPSPPPAPSGSLEGIGAPSVASTCTPSDLDGTYVAASSDAPLSTAAGESVTAGFEVTAPTGPDGCSTIYAWDLDHLGTFPYGTWQANAYPAASTPGAQDISVGSTWDRPLPTTVGGTAVAEPGAGSDGPTPTPVTVASGGSQLQVDLTADGDADASGAEALVLRVDTAAGADPAALVVAHDTLTGAGQDVPAPTPLFVAPAPPPTTTTTTTTAPSTSTSTTTSTTTTTTSPSTTTTTQPPACSLPDLDLAAKAAALWPLDDRSSTAADASGHGNTATITSAAAYDQTPGPLAGCPGNGGLQLDGSSTHVTAPSSVDPATTGSALTVAAFVKLASDATGAPRVIANDRTDSTGTGFELTLGTSGGAVSSGAFTVGLPGGAVTAPWTAALSDGGWHLLVGTYDGATVTAYVDGQPVGSAPGTGAITAGSEPVTLGWDPVQSSDALGGWMADAAVVPTALSAAQVASIWARAQGSS